jgi:GAF domain-containing protein
MQIAPTPSNEELRLSALRALLILDTPPEERFDRVVQFAAVEFEVPMVAISLVDANRQWFKARIGLEVCETGRDVSFCSHALLEPDVLIVEDAAFDPRFFDNPLVTGPPHVRFYAGAPLRVPGGEVLGTLCLIDTRSRGLDEYERAILRSLRDLAINELLSKPLPAGRGDVLASTALMSTLSAAFAPAGVVAAKQGA